MKALNGQHTADIYICHLFNHWLSAQAVLSKGGKEIQTTQCVSYASQKRRACQEVEGRKKIPKGHSMSVRSLGAALEAHILSLSQTRE